MSLDKHNLKIKGKRRRWAVAILTVTELLISPYIAYIVHQYCYWLSHLSDGSIILDYRYLKAVQNLFSNLGVQIWFVLLQTIYGFYLVWMLLRPRAVLADIREIKVTDKISIPVAIGNGQHGNQRFTTFNEQEQIFDTFTFTGCEKLDKGGLVVQMRKDKDVEVINFIKKDAHSLIIGITGSGKTRRILFETVCMQILSGISCVISDVKGEIFYYTKKYAENMGYKTIAIDLRNPKKSDHYNFLQPILNALDAGDRAKAIDYTWDLVSVLVGEAKGEPLWHNGETASIAAAILAVCIEADVQYRNLPNVYYFLAYMCQPDQQSGLVPLELYLATLADEHPAKTVFAVAQIAAERTRSSFFTSALGTLRLFTNPNVADMTSSSDFSLDDIGSKKTIMYLIIPDEKKTLYPLASVLIQQIYIAQVEQANRCGLRLPINTDYNLDEIGNFPTIPVLGNLLSAGRSRGCRANLVIQDYQQIQTKYKDDFETIKTCCEVKVYLKSDNLKTLEEISKTLDKYTIEVTSASTSASTGAKLNDANISNSSNMTGRELLMPSEISRIDYPYALCMVTGEYPSITVLPDLSEYRFNNLLELGSAEHNRKLIMQRENERKERIVEEIQLWGVWMKYKNSLELEQKATDDISFLNG